MATRTEIDPFEVSAAIDRIEGDAIPGRLQVNLSESLGVVPGLVVQNRNNYAQDLQLSIRGFGARSTFGIRGVRLYVDGIPATQPDGQGQRVQAAYTLLDARYRDAFSTCNATPCEADAPDRIGQSHSRRHGLQRICRALICARARLARRTRGRHVGKVHVDDANADSASRHTVFNARLGHLSRFARWNVESFARIDNMTDRRYAGSVIVNEGNRRFFEPAQGRAFIVGATATLD